MGAGPTPARRSHAEEEVLELGARSLCSARPTPGCPMAPLTRLSDPTLPLPPPDARLAAAIRDPQVALVVSELVQHAVLALTDMQRLDESLYERVQGSDAAAASAELIEQLSATIFRGLRAFIAVCRARRPAAAGASSPSGDFDFGDLEAAVAAAAPKATTDFQLDAGDIGDVLSSLDEHLHASEAERLSGVLEKVSSIEYGLSSQLDDLTARLKQTELVDAAQALELLDDTQTSASEGVYAALTAAYEAFLPDADPATLAPGYLTTLQRALLVRRGLAELAREVNFHNDVLQGEDVEQTRHEPALAQLRAAMSAFLQRDAFRAMRPADRFQVSRFELSLREQPLGAARLTSEGLARYLESLGSINRREVLIVHDQRRIDELRESVAAARQLSLIRPRLAVDPARRAVTAALALSGRHPATDGLIASLRKAAPALERDEVLELSLRVCERLLRQLT